MNSLKILSEIIQKRRAIFPNSYSGEPLEDSTILQILENANWAPNHKNTEPWRYKIFKGSSLHNLGLALADKHKEFTDEDSFSEVKYNKLLKNPSKAGCVIAICVHLSNKVPEWEEIAAVACSVQNMWLSCASLGIGAYWSSPKEALSLSNFLDLEANEKCLGLFYMGYPKIPWPNSQKGDFSDKIQWM